jgi:Domain of unknown function (DUF4345)
MTGIDTVNMIGALVTMGMGCLGLLTPNLAAKLVRLGPTSPEGFAEFRATYGGLFVALGLAPLIWPEPGLFLVAGLAWAGAAAGRLVSMVADETHLKFNSLSVVFECACAGLLLLGNPYLFA